jgi:DNA primase
VITQESIEEVVRRSDLLSMVERSRTVSRSGRNFKALCPFHEERTPSFYIWTDSNSYYCFGCHAAGNSITYLMETEGYSFPDAIEFLANQTGVQLKRTNVGSGSRARRASQDRRDLLFRAGLFAAKLYHQQLLTGEYAEQLEEYLQQRAISRDLVTKFQLGFAPRGSLIAALQKKGVDLGIGVQAGLLKQQQANFYEYLQGRLVFPIRTQAERVLGFGGRIVPGLSGESNAKYLNSPETDIYHKSEVLYGLWEAGDAIRHRDEVLVVEGYLDVLGLHRVGIENVVATCGTSFTEEHAKKLARLARRIILLFDGDQAGVRAAARALGVVGASKADIKIILLPDGQDPDDFARCWGEKTREQLSQLVRITPLDHFLNVQVALYGSKVSELGESAKHSILLAAVKEIASISQELVLEQLIERIAFKLGLATKLVRQALLEVRGRSVGSSIQSEVVEPPANAKAVNSVRRLAAVDKTLLTVAWALGANFPKEVLQDSAVVALLHPGVLQVLEHLFRDVLRANSNTEGVSESAANELVGDLLGSFGVNPTFLLAEVQALKDSGAERMLQMLRESVWYLRRMQLRRLSKDVELRLRHETSEEDRAQLAQAQLRLLRQSNAIKFDQPLEWEQTANVVIG